MVALFFGALTILGSSAQAHDRCYDDYRYSHDYYRGHRDTVRYERPYYRSYYYDDYRPVIVHRDIIVDDCPRYYVPRHHHHSGFRLFFGF